jgi:hypothetical protein
MSHSKNNLSMFTILFSLGISLSQVSAEGVINTPIGPIGPTGPINQLLPCSDEAKSSECCLVAQIYNQLSPNKVSVSSPTSCCNKGGVSCNGEKVTKIDWGGQSLTGNIPESVGSLTNLEIL